MTLRLQVRVTTTYTQLNERSRNFDLLRRTLTRTTPSNFMIPFTRGFQSLRPLLRTTRRKPRTSTIQHVLTLNTTRRRHYQTLGHDRTLPRTTTQLARQRLTLTELVTSHYAGGRVTTQLFLSRNAIGRCAGRLCSGLNVNNNTHAGHTRLTRLFTGGCWPRIGDVFRQPIMLFC